MSVGYGSLLGRAASAWRRLALGGLAILVLAAGLLVLVGQQARRTLPEGLIQANGRVEGDQVTIASKFPARVARLLAREGASVGRDQALVVLEDAQVDARIAQATAAVAQARERMRAADAALAQAFTVLAQAGAAFGQAAARAEEARDAVTVAATRVRAGRTGLTVLQSEVIVGAAGAEAALAEARARVARARAAEEQARRDADRYRRLADDGLVAPQLAEQAAAGADTSRHERHAAESAEAQAVHRLADARLGPERVTAREHEIVTLDAERVRAETAVAQADAAAEQARIGVAHAEAALVRAHAAMEEARGAHAQAKAALAEAESVRRDLSLAAPAAGVVMTRMVDEGEVVAAGAPLLELVDLDRLYLKVFVAETDIGRLRLGLPARVHVDAFPAEPVAATVRYIASRAEFTPKEVQTPSERVKLVYAVKLYLDANPGHRLTPGLPADAVIRWRPEVAWQRPRW